MIAAVTSVVPAFITPVVTAAVSSVVPVCDTNPIKLYYMQTQIHTHTKKKNTHTHARAHT